MDAVQDSPACTGNDGTSSTSAARLQQPGVHSSAYWPSAAALPGTRIRCCLYSSAWSYRLGDPSICHVHLSFHIPIAHSAVASATSLLFCILGRAFDSVERVPFTPAIDGPAEQSPGLGWPSVRAACIRYAMLSGSCTRRLALCMSPSTISSVKPSDNGGAAVSDGPQSVLTVYSSSSQTGPFASTPFTKSACPPLSSTVCEAFVKQKSFTPPFQSLIRPSRILTTTTLTSSSSI